MHQPCAYFNGQQIPASSLTVSPTDAGFVLGATVAEQLRTFAGKVFRLDDHLARLERSLAIIHLDPGIHRSELARAAEDLVATNHRLLDGDDDLGLGIFVTPGPYPAYGPAPDGTPNVSMHTYPLPFRLWADKYDNGQVLVTTEVEQVSPKCWPPQLKCRSRMHFFLADQHAAGIEPGARALLLDAGGWVSEASTANITIYQRKHGLLAPPHAKVLPGISLAVVWQLAAELGIATSERDLTVQDIAGADEVMLSSTPSCLVPVTRFNGRAVGDGTPGPVFRNILERWGHRVGVDIAGQARRFAGRA